MTDALTGILLKIRETTFATSHLVAHSKLSCSEVIGIAEIVPVVFPDIETIVQSLGSACRINSRAFHGTDKPDQHERSAQQDHAEVVHGDDDAQGADAEGDDREYAVESFCQDHAHAPTWGMILGQTRTRVFRQQNRPGSAQGGGAGSWLCQNGWLMSHEQNVPETGSISQTSLVNCGEAVIGIDVGQATGSRLEDNAIQAIHNARANFRKRATKQLARVSLESIMQSLIVFTAAALMALGASAQDQSPKQNAQDAAGVATDLMESTIKDTVNIEDIVPGFETADPDELTTHYEDKGADLETATQEALQDLDSRGGEAGALIVDTYATRPEQSVTRTEGFLATARGALETPEALTSGMFSVNQAPNCEPTEVNAVAPGVRSCDIYSNVDELKCALGQIVEVDAEKSYKCVRETASYLKTCPETLQVQCLEPVSNCRLEDGLLTTAFADLNVSYVNGLHRLSVTGIDGSDAGFDTITRRARLNITDLSKVTSFRLSNVDYRTALSLSVNGAPVYSGPMGDGVNPLTYGEFFQGEIGDGSGEYIWGILQGAEYLGPGRSLPPVEETVGLDLIDLLVEGDNVIEFDLIVVGTENGRAGIEFTILLSCCANWQAEWVRQCP